VPPASQPVPVPPSSTSVATLFKDGGAYGIVTQVELPFGNLDTSFVESDVRSIGIASADSFRFPMGMPLRLLKFSGGSVDDYAICRSS